MIAEGLSSYWGFEKDTSVTRHTDRTTIPSRSGWRNGGTLDAAGVHVGMGVHLPSGVLVGVGVEPGVAVELIGIMLIGVELIGRSVVLAGIIIGSIDSCAPHAIERMMMDAKAIAPGVPRLWLNNLFFLTIASLPVINGSLIVLTAAVILHSELL